MGVETAKYLRKPLYVDAVRITAANFDEIVTWCQGEVMTDEVPGGTAKRYIKVRVHNPKNPRQTKAFVGDWLLYTERGYKVYTNKAFHAAFDIVTAIIEEESPIEFPREEGDTVVLGPQCFVTKDGAVLNWRGVNYVPQGDLVPVPVTEADRAALEVPPTTPSMVTETEEKEIIENAKPVVEQDPEVAAAGKRVISQEEARSMTSEEVRELILSGEAILAEDLAEAN